MPGEVSHLEPAVMPLATASPRLSIVMPCLNEAETLATCIRKARNALSEMDFPVKSSSPTTAALTAPRPSLARAAPTWWRFPRKGYGCALRGGIAAARGEWIIMGDADDSYDFGSIAPFVEKLRDGFEFISMRARDR